jgi:hypothetical protein
VDGRAHEVRPAPDPRLGDAQARLREAVVVGRVGARGEEDLLADPRRLLGVQPALDERVLEREAAQERGKGVELARRDRDAAEDRACGGDVGGRGRGGGGGGGGRRRGGERRRGRLRERGRGRRRVVGGAARWRGVQALRTAEAP